MNTCGTFGTHHGRLGNQIFQMALLHAVRERHGYDFYLPPHGEALWECFDLDIPCAGPEPTHEFHEEHGSCNYDPRVFDQPDATAYRGYFQSYRYLEDCKSSLVRSLRFKSDHRARSEAMLYAYRRRYRRPLVSLHVRRTEYLLSEDKWGNLAKDGYYERAMALVGDDVTYLVFSDDLEWCRNYFDIEVVEFPEVDDYTTLCLMTGCDVNIIANSSFSWWGAYLNPNTEVIAPRRWWRALEPPNDRQDDIVPPGWRTIPTFGATDGAPMNQPVRNPKIEINQVEDGYVVYDENRDRVHYLNHTAVLVLELCNGEHSPEDIVAILQRTYELPEPPDEEVTACLRQLRREGMIR